MLDNNTPWAAGVSAIVIAATLELKRRGLLKVGEEGRDVDVVQQLNDLRKKDYEDIFGKSPEKK